MFLTFNWDLHFSKWSWYPPIAHKEWSSLLKFEPEPDAKLTGKTNKYMGVNAIFAIFFQAPKIIAKTGLSLEKVIQL